MATYIPKKVSEFPAAIELGEADLLFLEQGGSAKKLSGALLAAFCQAAIKALVESAGTSADKAEKARQAIEGLLVAATTLEPESAATVEKTIVDGVVKLTFGLPAGLKGEKGDAFTYEDFTEEQLAELKGDKGDAFTYEDFTAAQLALLKGAPGSSIQSIVRTAGTGAPGTTDTYTVTLTDGSTTTFKVYNGKDGAGSGDMTASVYDPQGKAVDVYAYADGAKDEAEEYADQQLGAHDADENAHAGLFAAKADLVNGVVPVSQLPSEVKECRIVADIAARDAITDVFAGLNVYVEDATADATVDSGGAYYLWNGSGWRKTSESESMDVVLRWENIQGKPDEFTPSAHTHEQSEVEGLEDALADKQDAITGTQGQLIGFGADGKPVAQDAVPAHTQAADTITAGTFAGAVAAGASAQDAGTSLLRNSKLVSADTTPTNNGEIFWTYG